MTRVLGVATALLVLSGLAGCSSDSGNSAAASTTSLARTMPSSPVTRSSAVDKCDPGIETVATSDVPKDVARWASGRPVVGVEHLWTVRSAIAVPPDHQQNVWRLKFPWFPRPFGLPRIDARRLDGPGTFRSDAHQADDQNGTWVVSMLEFSRPGCWEVSARYYDTNVLRFRIRVGPS